MCGFGSNEKIIEGYLPEYLGDWTRPGCQQYYSFWFFFAPIGFVLRFTQLALNIRNAVPFAVLKLVRRAVYRLEKQRG